MNVLGIDIGGSGIKGALVDVQTGTLVGERHRIPTPNPATPDAVIETVAQIVAHFDWKGFVGCGFPAVIKHGTVHTAANISSEWIGVSGQSKFEQATGCLVWLLNDADAAGLAEMQFGAGRGHQGVVLVVTLGTGIGTALFTDGHLVPNTELGHIEIRGKDAEKRASAEVRKIKSLDWDKWAERINEYFHAMEKLFWPDLIIVGGGVSKRHEKFFSLLTIRTKIVPAHLLNEAGMIGSALAAQSALGKS